MTRYTSKDIYVEWIPNSTGTVQPHIQKLYFDAALTGGTFALRVNGERTANITFNTTIATFLSAINTALDALNSLAAGEIVATGTASTEITLTSSGNKYYHIEVIDTGLIPSTVLQPVVTRVIQQGAKVYRLDYEMASLDETAEVETVDMTAISAFEEVVVPVKSSMTFSLMLYRSSGSEEMLHFLRSGEYGVITVYPTGKVVGNRYWSYPVLIESVQKNNPDHEKLEINIDGRRVGAMLIPHESVYKG